MKYGEKQCTVQRIPVRVNSVLYCAEREMIELEQ